MFCLHERERPEPKGMTFVPVIDFDVFDSFATSEVEESSLRAKIAVRFGVTQDAVVIHRGGVTVVLTMEEAKRL